MRRKKVQGKHYYQLVRNYRERGKHRQEILCHLGVHGSIEAAIQEAKQKVASYRTEVSTCEKEAARLRARWYEVHGEDAEFDDEYEAREELEFMRWNNPYRGSAYYYSRYRFWGEGEDAWDRDREEWEVKQNILELCVGYYDAMRDADMNRIRERQSREKLDKLIECQRKYLS